MKLREFWSNILPPSTSRPPKDHFPELGTERPGGRLLAHRGPWPIPDVQLFSLESFSPCRADRLGLKHCKATWEPLGGDWPVEAVPGSWAFWGVCLLPFSLPFPFLQLAAWCPAASCSVLRTTWHRSPLGLSFPAALLVQDSGRPSHCAPVQCWHRGPLDGESGALSGSLELERGPSIYGHGAGSGTDSPSWTCVGDTAGSLVGIALCIPRWEWLPSL